MDHATPSQNLPDPDQTIADLYSTFLQSFPDNQHSDQFYLTYLAEPTSPTQFDAIARQLDFVNQFVPGRASVDLLKGHIALRQKKLDEAVQLYENAVRNKQSMITGHGAECVFSLGVAHFLKGNYQAAVDAFGQYRQMQPEGPNVHKFFSYMMHSAHRQPTPAPQSQQFQFTPPPQRGSSYSPPTVPPPVAPQSSQIKIPKVGGGSSTPTPVKKPSAPVASCPKNAAPQTPCAQKQKSPAASPKVAAPNAAAKSSPTASTAVSSPSSKKAVRSESDEDGCFIATAAWGTPEAATVLQLRQFRDDYLKPSTWGRFFIRHYYRWSPPLANYIARRERWRSVIRFFLRQLIKILPQRIFS